MVELTEMETKVYEAIKEECKHEYCAWMEHITKRTGIDSKIARGVIGSLVKKELVEVEEDDYRVPGKIVHDYYAIVDGDRWSWAVEEGYCME